ncbi:MAG: hypothetical protein OEY95_05560 [Candidatus Bathyarchaeota archaeon]|nr:hypothetical protein [Candidatus Bathyarchaeota archaeon]
MSLRVLHLASINFMLKHKHKTSLCPDPLALVNLGDLGHLGKPKTVSFLEHVLMEFASFNPADDVAIRTAASTMEQEIHRPFRLHLKSKNRKRNALAAYEVSNSFSQQNPDMKANEAWLVFGLSIRELFSGNVCSDIYWPNKVVMEVASGPLGPLANGEITNPESWFLEKDTGRIYYQKGSNSPVLKKFAGKELKMTKTKELMTFAARMPCTLEFIYGYIRKIQDFAPLIIDVRVLPHVEWVFCGTRAVWKVLNSMHFLQMLGSISSIAAKNIKLIENEKRSSLMIDPKGSIIRSGSRNVSLRSLFGIEIFSPNYRVFDIQPLL